MPYILYVVCLHNIKFRFLNPLYFFFLILSSYENDHPHPSMYGSLILPSDVKNPRVGRREDHTESSGGWSSSSSSSGMIIELGKDESRRNSQGYIISRSLHLLFLSKSNLFIAREEEMIITRDDAKETPRHHMTTFRHLNQLQLNLKKSFSEALLFFMEKRGAHYKNWGGEKESRKSSGGRVEMWRSSSSSSSPPLINIWPEGKYVKMKVISTDHLQSQKINQKVIPLFTSHHL